MGVWIETFSAANNVRMRVVTPCVGVWIETENRDEVGQDLNVTPCVGVWIETENQQKPYTTLWVTPCVGVWIETMKYLKLTGMCLSHPAWVCGLKHVKHACKPFYDSHTLRGCVD